MQNKCKEHATFLEERFQSMPVRLCIVHALSYTECLNDCIYRQNTRKNNLYKIWQENCWVSLNMFFLLLQHTAYVGGEGNEIFNDIDFICILSGYH